ncbi:C4-dicarboxylate transporter, DctM subunit [Pseudoalteromonas ulvae UL12]|uniref:TRAP transporter large permease protein n=1 Tax=Pseudoalteromonas ulvae TaxID=107327 RepID=A0A244CPN0_PSEDV|nr:TRAP transporter large permease subunit [Pseudoalteromonas ulvae]MBE0365005.1 C4-dicarboxylate transporter, DctM subunit [Pseudoalteromonas ulvae UL12]OUL57564.1 C4-dicarboxylate ABC transporter permease [Pseudoalteromonas ulvae]
MDSLFIALCLAISLLTFLAIGLWVGFSLILIALIALFLNGNQAVGLIFSTTAWGHLTSWSLTALPLFIWMGELLYRAHIGKDLFDGLSPWLKRLPGGLLHINVFGSGIFAAVSGSSAATAATMGRMTLPELKKRGYSERLSIGSLAGSATLGLLIPPSIILIVYGVASDVSIAQLFLAGVIPGLVLMLLFSLYIIASHLHKPRAKTADISSLKKRHTVKKLLPITLLMCLVIGSIYSGLATPSESAALGVLGALLICKFKGLLTLNLVSDSLIACVKTTTMILFILLGASFLTMAMGFLQIPASLAIWVGELALSPATLLIALTAVFIILGLFLDGISIVILTCSILMPLIHQAGFDPIWFGIYLVVVVEMSQITPPVGFNLFVLKGITDRPLLEIAYAAMPFFIILLLSLVIFYHFPEVVLYLTR